MFNNEAVKDYVDNLRGKLEVNNESRLEEQFEDTFVRGAICGYNKANEWHYVKDKLPDHNGQFYVAVKGYTETFVLNYDYDEYDEYDESKMAWLDDDDTNFDDGVYAWREKLKAPKESE